MSREGTFPIGFSLVLHIYFGCIEMDTIDGYTTGRTHVATGNEVALSPVENCSLMTLSALRNIMVDHA